MRALVVALCATLSLAGCTRATTGSAATPPELRPWSAEEQLRDLVDAFETSWNERDYDGLRGMLCAELLAQDVFSDAELADARSAGTLELTILELQIDGDHAESVIANHGTDEDDIAFTLEHGDWKWCEY